MLLLLEHHIYRFYDSNLRMRFAINNDFMLQLFGPGNVEVGLLAKATVPTLYLVVSRCKCYARQRLHVYVSMASG
jgi:hypothetical protein